MSKLQTSRPVLFLTICVFLRFGPKVETSVGVQDFWISGRNACLFDGESTCLFVLDREETSEVMDIVEFPRMLTFHQLRGVVPKWKGPRKSSLPKRIQQFLRHDNVQGIKHNFVEKTKTGDKCRTYHRQWSQRHILLQQRPLQFSYRLVPSLRHTYSSCYPWNYH